MFIFYFLATLPLVPAAIFWRINKKIAVWEWALGSLFSFVLAGIFHLFVVFGMTTDYETLSGQITKTIFHPKWVEEYQVAIYETKTDSKGNSTQVFSHFETRYSTHSEYWSSICTINDEFFIEENIHEDIGVKFGNRLIAEEVYKSGFYSGDKNLYYYVNDTGYVYPTTKWKRFENRVKVAPSTFSYVKVPDTVPVFPYPENKNIFKSDRLLGSAQNQIDIIKFDQLNSLLGPTKKVNLILIGFESNDSSFGQLQEAKWIGGKKNDLVICYGGHNGDSPTWVHCFGWTEHEIVKRNLETLFLNHPVKNSILSHIKQEVIANYEIKEWSKFDYLTIEPPLWSYVTFIVFMITMQAGFWFYAHKNEFNEITV
jgi:hypothetical protein